MPVEIKKFIGNKNTKTNIYRIQANNLVIFGNFCIAFIYFILKDKSLLNYAIIFSLEKNDKIILKYFQ